MGTLQVNKTKRLSTDDTQVNGQPGGVIPDAGAAEFHPDDIQIVTEPLGGSRTDAKIAEAAFMNELVEIFIEEDDSPTAPLFVHSAHNGITQYIKRGVAQTIKRKFLYSLLTAKHTAFACSYGMAEGGENNKLTPKARTTHRLYVNRDDNPKGRQWMAGVLANGG